VLLSIQAGPLLVVKPDSSLSAYSNVIHVVYFLLLLLATGILTLNAIRSEQTIRLFWSFLACGCGLRAVNAWIWVHEVAILGKDHPGFVASAAPLYLHTIFLIAAIASRPHLKLSRDKPHRTTLTILLLLFFFGFASMPLSYFRSRSIPRMSCAPKPYTLLKTSFCSRFWGPQ
jgi:hypothetical protein